MPRTIHADGRTVTVPDDATPEEINQIFGPAPAAETPAKASTFRGGMIEGAKDLGQGLANIPHAILHPLDTFNAMGAQQRALADRASADAKAGHYGNAIWHGVDAMLPGIGPLDAQLTDEYQSGAPGAKSAAMGRTLVNALPSVALEGARPIAASVARGVGSGLNNIAIGTTDADRAFGANPGAALYDNGITGFSGPSLAGKVDAAIPQAAAAHNADLTQYGAGKTVSLGDTVNAPFKSALGAKTDPRTGIVNPVQVAKLNKAQRLINSVPDPDTGQPTMAPRPLNDLSPVEANTFKSNLYGMANYDTPTANALANNAVKGAAHNVKTAIQRVVPESVQSGQDLHNLMSAKDVLQPAARAYRLPTSKEGLLHGAIQGGATTSAQLLKAGAQALPLAQLPLAVLPRTEVDGVQEPQPMEGNAEAQPNQGNQQVPDQGGQENTQSDLANEQHGSQSITPESTASTLKPLDRETAEGYYDQAGGDPEAARALAAKDGYDITGSSDQ